MQSPYDGCTSTCEEEWSSFDDGTAPSNRTPRLRIVSGWLRNLLSTQQPNGPPRPLHYLGSPAIAGLLWAPSSANSGPRKTRVSLKAPVQVSRRLTGSRLPQPWARELWPPTESMHWSSEESPAAFRLLALTGKCSIIFIHGLTGGRESTWTATGAAACWPELFLPNDLPEARIITYGYDADVVNFWSMASQNTVGDHSQKFLTSLANLRYSTNTVCLLAAIWAARLRFYHLEHETARIRCAQSRRNCLPRCEARFAFPRGLADIWWALLKSRGSADRYTQRILEYTRGILFLGTPHCG